MAQAGGERYGDLSQEITKKRVCPTFSTCRNCPLQPPESYKCANIRVRHSQPDGKDKKGSYAAPDAQNADAMVVMDRIISGFYIRRLQEQLYQILGQKEEMMTVHRPGQKPHVTSHIPKPKPKKKAKK